MHRNVMKLIPGLLAAILLIAAAGNPALAKDRVDILLTRGTGQIWEPVNPSDEYTAQQAEEELSAALADLRDEYPEAFLIDLGRWATPGRGMETSYDSRHVSFFGDNGYDAVNVTALDYALGVAHAQGVRKRPPEMNDFYVSSYNIRLDDYPALPSHADPEREGRTIRIASVGRPSVIAALPTVLGDAAIARDDVVMKEADTADAPNLLIALSELDAAREELLFGAYPGLDVIVHAGDTSQEKVAGDDGQFVVPSPGGNEIGHLRIELDDDGTVRDAKFKRIEWTARENYDSLVDFGLPTIGMSVPGEGRVADILRIDENNVLLDVHRGIDFPDLTDRRNIYAYNIIIDDVPYRAYRVYHRPAIFWAPQDQLVILNRNNTIRRIVTNLETYPLTSWNTRLGEGLQQILNKPPDQWNLPPETTAGIEVHADRIVESLRATLEVNRRLYPYDGDGAGT